MRFQLPSVASASTIMIATSSLPSASVTTRPATIRSNTASSSCVSGRERDPLVGVVAVAGDEREAHTGDRAGERQTGDLGRERRGVDRERVVELAGRDREHGDDDLDLVAEAVDERRAQRAVDETADEDRLGRGAALATEERAGDLAGGVRALFDVDRQREEVEAFARVLAGAGGREEHRLLVEVRGDGALRLLRETAGLEADGAGAELAVVENGFGERDFRTFQEVSLLCLDSPARVARECDSKEQEQADFSTACDALALVTSGSPPAADGEIGDWETTTGDQHPAGLLRSGSYEIERMPEGNLHKPTSAPVGCRDRPRLAARRGIDLGWKA